MIHDLDASLQALLEGEVPIKDNAIAVKFDQPSRAWSNETGNKSTLNLFLYDVRENNTLRSHQWEMVDTANGNGRSQRRRSPFRIDCHYVLTAWAKETEDQHRLLSLAMFALLRHPVIPSQYQVGSMREQPFEIQARLASHDRLTNPAELWSALDNEIRPGVSYIVTIAINPWQAEATAPPVHTKRLALQWRDWPETAVESVEIAGRITGDDPLPPGVTVTLANERWHYEAPVGENGRYAINAVIPDNYTLAAWTQTGPQARRKLGARTVIVPPPVRILAFADTFRLQIGPEVRLDDLHLSPRRAGFIGQAGLAGFTVRAIGSQLPRSGVYHFGRSQAEDSQAEEVTAVIPAAVPNQTSFQLVYKKTEEDIGDYNLAI